MPQQSVTTAPVSTPGVSLLARHHFLLRRLHSLSGIVPVGLFVTFHLFTNFQMIRGPGEFQHEVDFIHATPALLFVEIGLWLSIGFHAVLGTAYIIGWAPNALHYRYPSNWRYTLQRLTAWIALVFIFVHVYTLRWRLPLGGWQTHFYATGPAGEPLAHATTAMALQAHWLVAVFYLVGVLGTVYHWCNGLWTAAITWGLTISVGAQRRWGYLCAAMGVVLVIFAIGAIVGALTYPITDADRAVYKERLLQGTGEMVDH